MKKTLILAIIFIATCTVSLAQPRAIGGRLGWGAGVSYQHGLGDKNMLQVDLDVSRFNMGIQATATYNWIFPFNSWKGAGSWNWYAGVGGGVGMYWPDWWRYPTNHQVKIDDRSAKLFVGFAGATGMIGVEYNFKFPLQLSLDWCPLIGPSFYKGGVGFNLLGVFGGGLGIRYKF
ncbi:MAG: hypothetical protein FWC34_09255 [Bacteroidetes bacterium]|nr:hypothetical protein [Bacteroidota bacterium]MCL2303014.1 hypothetical protein [Lentimicrobiaceae bacterium]